MTASISSRVWGARGVAWIRNKPARRRNQGPAATPVTRRSSSTRRLCSREERPSPSSDPRTLRVYMSG